MVFRYHFWNRKPPEVMLRTLLTGSAQEVRFERVAVGPTYYERTSEKTNLFSSPVNKQGQGSSSGALALSFAGSPGPIA
jgi:hypothetical protein